ncbi:MAG: DNA primase [Candidatus Paraprevotella stercoravium]|uniref:DNA primase n=1 Tax=Candidatus Paraprevotella stercoravium TaxID=2838725 RepID=A0A9E2P218_9BACT|nr:DNA primase [Candidatus Paraprevotella stercoravium]
MIDPRIIQEILDRADIVDVVSDSVDLKKRGSTYEACCPFHSEKTPSFKVSPSRGTWHCFGSCQEGGNAISFVMKDKNLTFVEAVKWLGHKCGVSVPDDYQPSEEQQMLYLKREAMQVINAKLGDYFVQNLKSEEGKDALAYAVSRWGQEFVEEKGIGFALNDYQAIPNYIHKTGLSVDLSLELGVLKKSEKGGYYGFYRNRLMIPIRDRYNQIVGFTARDLSGMDDTAKYLNSSNSDCYNKSETIFGLDVAIRQASKENIFYCVEGAPDVLRLQLIGHNNAIAPLGGNWTEKQLESIKRYASKLCFIPDSDPVKDGQKFGPGVSYVRKHGRLAVKMGYTVLVREIPLAEGGGKQDADSFFSDKGKWNLVDEEDFIIWYAKGSFANITTTEDKSEAIKDVAEMLAMLNDPIKEGMYLEQLNALYKGKNLWQNAINNARKRLYEGNRTEDKKLDIDLYALYGFYKEKHQYYSFTKDGDRFMWSNFEMQPMFHIKDSINPKRLYKIINYQGKTEIIEMKQEDLISLAKFQQKVEGQGNYIWMASAKELTKLKKYLYEQTETAEEITQLGYQPKGKFYAFGNGVFDTDWHPVDEYGIVRLGERGNYYLPASSKIYRDETKLFQFERRFVHLNYNSVGMGEYFQLLIDVFGDNAKVGICFLLATLFRDIITGYTKTFPILNLFGPKGSGKSELGHSLMAFFIIENVPPNIQNSTIAAMADLVAQCANALVHIDEFKNNIDIDKREFLKGLWDGAGRSRMNMDRDKKREITSVDCGVILSGQEMATADIALFSRFVYLTFNCCEYDDDAKRKFNEMKEVRKRGLTHLTLQILKHRARFETDFITNYNRCTNDILDKLKGEQIEDRILRNWLIPLAAFRTLEGAIDMPFGYQEIMNVCIEGIKRQNAECKSNNELAQFWNVVAYLQQNGEIFNEGDYRINMRRTLKTNIMKVPTEYPDPRKILFIRKNRIFQLYKKFGRMVGDSVLPEGSLLYYLENSKEYMGVLPSVRFKNIQKGLEVTHVEATATGAQAIKESSVDRALCFDYEKVSEVYGINLEIIRGNDPNVVDMAEENE